MTDRLPPDSFAARACAALRHVRFGHDDQREAAVVSSAIARLGRGLRVPKPQAAALARIIRSFRQQIRDPEVIALADAEAAAASYPQPARPAVAAGG